MIPALFQKTLKQNWVLLLIFFGVLVMYMSSMLAMYDPANMEGLMLMIEAFPEALSAAMGFDAIPLDLTGYLASWLYGMLMIGFPLVYSIILGNRLVAAMVDSGSFAFLLSTPHSRRKLIITQGVYAVSSMLILFTAVFVVGMLSAQALFPGELDIAGFLRLNVTTMLVNTVVLMISFFFSCVFNESRLALAFGSGVPITFLLMKMLSESAPGLGFLARASIFGFYDPLKVAAGEPVLVTNVIYIGLVAALFAAGTAVFCRKRLPL
ncbi:MAG: ABC transporter permease subunit [Selenomonadales bacterium]|nr:ABC transporter permease subunit [Selenomonadales bacterium]